MTKKQEVSKTGKTGKSEPKAMVPPEGKPMLEENELTIKPSDDFQVTFNSPEDNELTILHIPWNQVSTVAELLNGWLKTRNINCTIEKVKKV